MTNHIHDFIDWMQQSEQELNAQKEHARQIIARYITRSVKHRMEQGMSLDDAGDSIIKAIGWSSVDGVMSSPAAVRSILLEMGWRPKRAHARRGAA